MALIKKSILVLAKILGIDDINDDGFGELIVGIPDSSTNGSSSGRIEIYSGRNILDEIIEPLFVMEGDGAQSNLGGNFS